MYIGLCMSVIRSLSKAFAHEVPFRTSSISPGDTGQVRIWRSSGQGQYQGHRNKNGRKSLFPQCETSIGNNSRSITHRAVKFACSMGFSAMADRMVWPLSLSSDRKWPLATKCTHSRVVDFILEGNFVLMFILANFRPIVFQNFSPVGNWFLLRYGPMNLLPAAVTRRLLVAPGPVQFMYCEIDHGDGKRPRGRPNNKWLENIKENCSDMGITMHKSWTP